MKNSRTNWLVKTAAGIALVIIAQFIGKMIPSIAVIFGPFSVSQLITGSLINFILFTMTMLVDAKSGVTIGILSSVLATIIGVGPIFPIITPAIALANAILVIIFILLYNKEIKPMKYIAITGAAIAKFAFLSVTVPFILQYIPDIKEVQITMLKVMFSWPQLITAVCGGLLSGICYPLIQKGVNKD